MGESIREIESEIAAERDQLGRNIQVLEAQARRLTDWRGYYQRLPGRVLGVAVVGGVALGAAVGGIRKASGGRQLQLPHSRSRSLVRDRFQREWHVISDALLGLASTKLVEAIGGFIPGFSDHVRRPPE
jgi:hypothetical protein